MDKIKLIFTSLKHWLFPDNKALKHELQLVTELLRSLENQTLNHLNMMSAVVGYNYRTLIIDGRFLDRDTLLDRVFEYDVEVEIGKYIEISRITYNDLILISYIENED